MESPDHVESWLTRNNLVESTLALLSSAAVTELKGFDSVSMRRVLRSIFCGFMAIYLVLGQFASASAALVVEMDGEIYIRNNETGTRIWLLCMHPEEMEEYLERTGTPEALDPLDEPHLAIPLSYVDADAGSAPCKVMATVSSTTSFDLLLACPVCDVLMVDVLPVWLPPPRPPDFMSWGQLPFLQTTVLRQ